MEPSDSKYKYDKKYEDISLTEKTESKHQYDLNSMDGDKGKALNIKISDSGENIYDQNLSSSYKMYMPFGEFNKNTSDNEEKNP